MTETPIIGGMLAAVGLCLGSYVTTAALRWSRGQQSSLGRSSCDHCGTQLSFARTTPVLSYLCQAGVCAGCGGRIDPIHLFGELAGAGVLVTAFAVAMPLQAALLSCLGLLLLAEAVCDAKTGRLPNALTLAVTLAGLALAGSRSFQAVLTGLITGAVVFVLLEGLRRLYLKWRRRPGLGFGDVKLLAALSLWTGLETPWVVVVAALVGLAAVALRPPANGRLAFGPCIALGAWIVGITLGARL